MLSKQIIGRGIRNLGENARTGLSLVQQMRPVSSGSDDEDQKRRFYQPGAGRPTKFSDMLKADFSAWFKDSSAKSGTFPRESDIVIIGGGLVGSAAAYFLKTKTWRSDAYKVTVIERDPTYTRCSSLLSVGGIRHQFSVPENIQMSLFTTEFLRNIKSHLSLFDEDPPDVQFNHHGYMFLASPDKVDKLKELVEMQRELGAQTTMYDKDQLAKLYPWLNLDGVEAASYGLYGEGWFDPWSLLKALKNKNISMGVQYCDAELIGFNTNIEQIPQNKVPKLTEVKLRDKDGDKFDIQFYTCINCAGAWAGEVARMAGIGTPYDPIGAPLPVEPRKRFVYCVHCPDGPGLDTPLLVDTTGAYFRREGLGGCYLMGASPDSETEEPDHSNLDVDYDFFDEKVWPRIAHRVSAFEKLKLRSAWAGYYDYNYVDQNLVIGPHPIHTNFYFANGMSGHGVQQAVAIGNALSELIIDAEYSTINLSRFGFERFLENEPVREDFIV